MVATPGKTVTRWLAIALSASSGVNRGRKITDPPASSGAITAPKIPSEWASGSADRQTSSHDRSITGPRQEASASALAPCDSRTPLGVPVLPEV